VTYFVAAFVSALLVALLLTPPVRRLAWAVGYLDHPEARKLHTHATPLLGGVVVFGAALLGWVVGVLLLPATNVPELRWWLTGAVMALALGLVDDRFGMNPWLKLGGQAASAAVFLAAGGAPFLGLGAVADAAVSLLFMVTLMNAVNFLDNMDGVVSGLGAIAFVALAVGALQRGAQGSAACCLALAGACLGFLRYNLRHASIFLGDAGSLFLGYSLGASALLAMRAESSGWSRMGIALILAYPLFDLIFVVIMRLRDGRPFYLGGRDHTNHRLASVLKCQTRTVPILYLSGAALAASGLWVRALQRPEPALLMWGLWALLLIAAGWGLARVPVQKPS
jgi:UDP-GlcNAc:undecaprenyl-phosphate GlcNAc-1-phosphate transferase